MGRDSVKDVMVSPPRAVNVNKGGKNKRYKGLVPGNIAFKIGVLRIFKTYTVGG